MGLETSSRSTKVVSSTSLDDKSWQNRSSFTILHSSKLEERILPVIEGTIDGACIARVAELLLLSAAFETGGRSQTRIL